MSEQDSVWKVADAEALCSSGCSSTSTADGYFNNRGRIYTSAPAGNSYETYFDSKNSSDGCWETSGSADTYTNAAAETHCASYSSIPNSAQFYRETTSSDETYRYSNWLNYPDATNVISIAHSAPQNSTEHPELPPPCMEQSADHTAIGHHTGSSPSPETDSSSPNSANFHRKTTSSDETYRYSNWLNYPDAPNVISIAHSTPQNSTEHPKLPPPCMEQSIDHSAIGHQTGSSRSLETNPVSTPSIPVVIEFEEEGINTWNLDLQLVREKIEALTGDHRLKVRVPSSDYITVYVSTSEAAIKLQRMTSLLGTGVNASLASWYNENIGKILYVPLHVRSKDIFEELIPYGVIGARRSSSYVRVSNSVSIEMPRKTVILNFATHVTELPTCVPVSGKWYTVKRCHKHPDQCMRCLGFLHNQLQCREPPRCKYCAGFHYHKNCPNSTGPRRCANCGGQHLATYSMCPIKWMYVTEYLMNKQQNEEATASSSAPTPP
ncbi:hypothetical protein HPB48_014596 [Haemaphysalis longicornis]|uniref:Nucleic-acid-binding protein from transposon X-element n=1 Tax=Haemaphysalis longicornis TaxID=44386 RepID=A0A9J6GZ16_HAELO|nr:hypothetical protein HPB48_014596 [Haemaphysalis longicornis]